MVREDQSFEADVVLNSLFDAARTHASFLPKDVPVSVLKELYEHVKWGPTSMNCQPLRIRWITSKKAREQLASCVYEGNRAKILSAPVTAVLGMDLDFVSTLPKVFPHKLDAVAYYTGKPVLVESTALRNSSLQAGYLIMAARLLGLGCGPMSGFDPAQVDALCWQGTKVRTNFLCNMGYGDPADLFPRSPRLTFEECCDVR